MPGTEILLAVRKVTFGYRQDPVLVEVSLPIRRGDYLVLLGPNGGGKSTLIRLLLGFEKPWAGTIERHLDEGRRSIGWVPQVSRFDRDFPASVLDMVLLGRIGQRGLFRRFNADDREQARAALEEVRLANFSSEPVRHLSSGQLQRLLIARALVAEPQLLLLDEPITSIDAESRTTLLRSLRRLHDSGMTLVVVTHDLTPFAADVRQVACLNRRLHYHDKPEVPTATLEEVYGCQVDFLSHGGLAHLSQALAEEDAPTRSAGGGVPRD